MKVYGGKNMQLSRMQDIFNKLGKREKIDLTEEEISFLVDQGLLKVMAAKEYEKIETENRGRYELNRSIESQLHECLDIERKRDEINEFFKTFVAKISLKSGNDKKREELKRLNEELAGKQETIEKLRNKRNELDAAREDISGYVPADDGYIKITEKGKERIRFMQPLISKLKESSYEQTEKEIDMVLEMINSKSRRIQEIYDILVQKNKFSTSENTARFAAVLWRMKGDIDGNVSRAHIVDDRIYGRGFSNSDRMDVVSFAVLQDGDMNYFSDRLVEMFLIMCGDDYSKNYSTWKIAAGILRVHGHYALDKYSRVDDILNVLKEKGWSKRGMESNFVALDLALKEGSVAEIVGEFVSFRTRLVKRGAIDSSRLGVASLLLGQSGYDFDKSADKFMKVLDVMRANRWDTSTSSYPLAAMISLLNGETEVILLLLKEAIESLKKIGFRRPDYLAMLLIADVANEIRHDPDSENSLNFFTEKSEDRQAGEKSVMAVRDFDAFEKRLLEWIVLGTFDQ